MELEEIELVASKSEHMVSQSELEERVSSQLSRNSRLLQHLLASRVSLMDADYDCRGPPLLSCWSQDPRVLAINETIYCSITETMFFFSFKVALTGTILNLSVPVIISSIEKPVISAT